MIVTDLGHVTNASSTAENAVGDTGTISFPFSFFNVTNRHQPKERETIESIVVVEGSEIPVGVGAVGDASEIGLTGRVVRGVTNPRNRSVSLAVTLVTDGAAVTATLAQEAR